jgi:hypothetical protein
MRHSAPTAQIRGVALALASNGSIVMGVSGGCGGTFIHTCAILKSPIVAKVKNHVDIKQVFEFKGFFSAQNRSELIKRPFHAGWRGRGGGFSTKLSTKDVGTCLTDNRT